MTTLVQQAPYLMLACSQHKTVKDGEMHVEYCVTVCPP
jgi:hypothetical protein